MPRPPKNNPSTRLNLEMGEQVRKRLEHLRDVTQADSLAEVIRRALTVYDFLWSERDQGGKLVVKREDGEKELVLL
jgi:hypothetical protein